MKPWKRTRKGAQPGNYMIVDRATGEVCGEVVQLDRQTWHWLPVEKEKGQWWGLADYMSEAAGVMHSRWMKRRTQC